MNKQGVFARAAIAVLMNREHKAKAKGEAIIKKNFFSSANKKSI
jgi:hypothetical protein